MSEPRDLERGSFREEPVAVRASGVSEMTSLCVASTWRFKIKNAACLGNFMGELLFERIVGQARFFKPLVLREQPESPFRQAFAL